MLIASTRIFEDICKSLDFGDSLFSLHIVVREWLDEVPENPEMEFRGFVHKGKLNALTKV